MPVSVRVHYTRCHPVNRAKEPSDFGEKLGARCKLNFNDGTEIDISVSNHIDFICILFLTNQNRRSNTRRYRFQIFSFKRQGNLSI